jgi:two-component system, OmpR family, response regulator
MNTENHSIVPLNKIILVEDEPDIQTVAKIALEAMGKFTIQIFASGSQIIQQADSLSADLILMDMMMPDMDGISVLEKLRSIPHTAKIPVIFMTAKVSQPEIITYKKIGAIGVIAKPFDPMTLADTVKKIWRENYGG